MKERKRDPYYLLAKKEEYRSRAAFKLIQLQRKFGLIRPGDMCLDLGCSPGGWLQVEMEYAGPGGKVFGVDIASVRELPPAVIIRGDMLSRDTIEKVLSMAGSRFDIILSDASPSISGNYSLDHARSCDLVLGALTASEMALKTGGKMVAKLFDGEERKSVLEEIAKHFQTVSVSKPAASRKQSSELYIVAEGFTG